MRSYREAIGRMDLRGKTVLDVGCGTGLLACWCAQQGAARVVAVEASPMARAAREVVEANGLGAVVEVAECRVEELQLAPRSVHLIVSEWMGFHLVNESMLDSVGAQSLLVAVALLIVMVSYSFLLLILQVLFARDAFLALGGRLLPGAARLLAAPVQCDGDAAFWCDAARTGGLDMSSLARLAIAERCAVPAMELVPPEALLAAPAVAASWDLHTLSREDARRIDAQVRVWA
jgi:SAM-dependent methyltransferase